MFSEVSLRNAAAACFINAESLREEARLLSGNRYEARAAALAIIGVEEFAKAIVWTVGALLPEQRNLLPSKLYVHEVKHIIAGYAEVAQSECNDDFLVLAQESGYWPTAQVRLTLMFRRIAGYGLRTLLSPPQVARKYYEALQRDFAEIFVDPYLKNQVLYVDLTPTGEVLMPDRLEDPAESQILGLEWFLDEYRGLPELLIDDAAWNKLCGSVRETSHS
ncbi:MAG: AbiV family abortive infection protein [Candidatus Binatia bacterium]